MNNRINQKDLKDHYINLVSEYYMNSMPKDEAVKEAKKTVKQWYEDAKKTSDPKAVFDEKFRALTGAYRQKQTPMPKGTDPLEMVAEMKNALNDIHNFRETTQFIGQNDLMLLNQLIGFINTCKQKDQNTIANDQRTKDQIQLYYERLFIPIHKTIMKKNGSVQSPPPSSSMSSMNQSPVPVNEHTGMMPRIPSQPHMQTPTQGPPQPPLVPIGQPKIMPPPPSSQGGMSQMQPPLQQIGRGGRQPQMPMPPIPNSQPPMNQMVQPSMVMQPQVPAPMAQPPPQPDPMPPVPQPTQQDAKKIIQGLFGQVRTECAVFYATPHPPHF